MNKEFVPYQESVELKALGFDEPCFGYYEPNKEFNYINWETFKDFPYLAKNSEWQDLYGAPTFSQAFRWFREKYELRHSITDFIDDETGIEWDYEIAIIGTDSDENGTYKPLVDYSVDDETRKFKTYEEAELACLIKLIEIAKENKQ